MATTAHVLGLKEHEMEMLANFLGHDIKIHTYFYRMPLDVLQIARVSKVFLAAERGHSSRHAGKGLSEVNTEHTEEVELEDDDDIDEDDVEDCSSQPDVASASGKESTDCSSQPDVASAPGKESTVGTLPRRVAIDQMKLTQR